MAYNFKTTKVLIVESSPPLYELLKGVLGLFSVPEENIFSAYSKDEGFRKFCKESHDLLIVDWLDNPNSGIKLTRQIRTDRLSPNLYVPILMTAGSGHAAKVLLSRDAGVSGYMVKPFSAKAIAHRLERIIESPRPFIVHDTFTGPDRRVKQIALTVPDRRQMAPENK